MKANGTLTVRGMEMDCLLTLTETCTKEVGSETKSMAKEDTLEPNKVMSTLVIGLMVRDTDVGATITQKLISTKEIGTRMRDTARECRNGKMELSTMANGLITSDTEKVKKSGQTEAITKATGSKEGKMEKALPVSKVA